MDSDLLNSDSEGADDSPRGTQGLSLPSININEATQATIR